MACGSGALKNLSGIMKFARIFQPKTCFPLPGGSDFVIDRALNKIMCQITKLTQKLFKKHKINASGLNATECLCILRYELKREAHIHQELKGA